MSRISDDLIRQGMSDGGAWTREQLAILGVSWPPPQGWRRNVIGNDILPQDAARFIALKNTSRKMRKYAESVALKPVSAAGVIVWGHCRGQRIADQTDEALSGAIWAAERGIGGEGYRDELNVEHERRMAAR